MTTSRINFTAKCQDCGQPYSSPYFAGVVITKFCRPCTDARQVSWERDRQAVHRRSVANMQREFREAPQRGIPRRYRGFTWADFHFDRGGDGNRSRVAEIRAYADGFPVDGPPVGQSSLILSSPMNGVGKTMLASLLVGEIIGRYEDLGRERSPFQFWSMSDIRQRLKTADRFGSVETPEDVYRDFASMWLLVLDDVGKEQLDGRDAGLVYDMYFSIIDQRYNNQLPVVITSNLGAEPWEANGPSLVDLMGRASVSRLVEMTGGAVYRIDGEDRR